jgi:transposase InsO family protein
MSPSNHLTLAQKHAFVELALVPESTVAEVCRAFRISRQTGYKWLDRYNESGFSGLVEQSRRPHHCARATSELWVERLRLARHRHKRWGPRKLRAWLQRQHPRSLVPSVSTLSRLLRRHGWSRSPLGRRRGPDRAWPAIRRARRPNEIWTVDFKGYFHTADGRRCDPLTVKDAFSRYGLCVRVLHGHKLASVQREFIRLFQRFGLPLRIHADQGRPWAGPGPAWLSQLSAWWVSLGILPTFSRRARPGDNASHEQWHRELKADTTRPPAATPPAQQRRFQSWLLVYNQERPHDSLGLVTPAEIYYRSRRQYRGASPPRYPRGWTAKRVRPNGEIYWQGRSRYIGEAFVRQEVGLKPWRQDRWRVYFYTWLIGELHTSDLGAMRPAIYHRRRKPKVSAMS